MAEVLLNVADIQLGSSVNGPGTRSVIWVQGCRKRCPGCFNPHTHPHEARHLCNPAELGRYLAGLPGTDGITISGGEPFEQAQACSNLAATVRAMGRSVMVFSGWTFELIRNSSLEEVKRFVEQIDLLVAGPYVRELPGDGTDWRGSTNQTIHFLTDRLQHESAPSEGILPVVEVQTDGRVVRVTGFAADEDQEWLSRLAYRGVPDSPRSDGVYGERNEMSLSMCRCVPRSGRGTGSAAGTVAMSTL